MSSIPVAGRPEAARDIAMAYVRATLPKMLVGKTGAPRTDSSVSLRLTQAPRTGGRQRTADEPDWDRRFLGRPA